MMKFNRETRRHLVQEHSNALVMSYRALQQFLGYVTGAAAVSGAVFGDPQRAAALDQRLLLFPRWELMFSRAAFTGTFCCLSRL